MVQGLFDIVEGSMGLLKLKLSTVEGVDELHDICVEDRMVLIIDIGRRGKWDRDWRRLIESNVTHSCLQFSTLREEDGKGRRSDCGKWGVRK